MMHPQKSLSTRAWLEMGLLSLIWGGSFLSIRLALDELSFLNLVAWRVAPAALALWLYVAWRGLAVPRQARIWGAFLVMGLLNNVIPFCLMAWGQQYIETGLTSILNASTAIFGVLAAAIFLRDERLSPRKTLGVSVGFLGVATAIGLSNLAELDLRSLAQLAVIGGTMSYALAGVWARKTLGGLSPQVAAAGMLTGSSVIILPLAWALEGLHLPHLGATWGAVGYMSLIATATAYLFYYRVLGMAGSGNLMLVTLTVAPVAISLGVWVRAEALAPQAFAGFGLLAVGLLILDGRIWRALTQRRD